MADEAPPTAQPEDFGGPPHVQQVSQTLQYWIIPAGILIFLSIGSDRHLFTRMLQRLVYFPRLALLSLPPAYLIYKLMERQNSRKKKKKKDKKDKKTK